MWADECRTCSKLLDLKRFDPESYECRIDGDNAIVVARGKPPSSHGKPAIGASTNLAALLAISASLSEYITIMYGHHTFSRVLRGIQSAWLPILLEVS